MINKGTESNLYSNKVLYSKEYIGRLLLVRSLHWSGKDSESAVFTDLEFKIAMFLLEGRLSSNSSFDKALNYPNLSKLSQKFDERGYSSTQPDDTVAGYTIKKLVAHGLIDKEKDCRPKNLDGPVFLRITFRLDIIQEDGFVAHNTIEDAIEARDARKERIKKQKYTELKLTSNQVSS